MDNRPEADGWVADMALRVVGSLVLGLLLVVFLPMFIPDGQGGTVQPWQRLLLDPVKAWNLGYHVDPYRSLFRQLKRTLREEGPVSVRVERARDGSISASNLPEASGHEIMLVDSNADLASPTREQGTVALLVCWALVSGLLYFCFPSGEARRGPAKGEAELISYKVESRTRRPIRDITPDDEPRDERAASQAISRSAAMQETETERKLLS